MSDQSTIKKIYSDEKAKNFVNHILSAYVPQHKIIKILDFEKGQKHECSICKAKLISISGALQNFNKNADVVFKGTMDNIKKEINGETPDENPMIKHVAKGRVLAFTGKDTTTLMCNSCIQDLYEMVEWGILTGDKNITWKLNQLQRKQYFNSFSDSSDLNAEEKKTAKKIERTIERSKSKTTTLGDLDALKKLHQKMKFNEG